MWDKDGPKIIKIVTVLGGDGDMVSRTPIGTTIELSWLNHITHTNLTTMTQHLNLLFFYSYLNSQYISFV